MQEWVSSEISLFVRLCCVRSETEMRWTGSMWQLRTLQSEFVDLPAELDLLLKKQIASLRRSFQRGPIVQR